MKIAMHVTVDEKLGHTIILTASKSFSEQERLTRLLQTLYYALGVTPENEYTELPDFIYSLKAMHDGKGELACRWTSRKALNDYSDRMREAWAVMHELTTAHYAPPDKWPYS